MFRWVVVAVALGSSGAAFAQDDAQRGPVERVRSVILHGEESCPKAESENEVVVCAREEDSPFRIPSKLRESVERPDATSWAVRVDDVMDANRAGLPNSCSPIGSGGQTGCTMQMLQQWLAARREQQRRDAAIP